MSISFISTDRPSHVICELKYETKIEEVTAKGFSLDIECVTDLDQSIDLVFGYLNHLGYETDEILGLAPYFGVVWPSALALADWVVGEGQRGQLQGKRVLELGCGLGVPGICAAKFGAKVVFTDYHPGVFRFLTNNLCRNGVETADLFYGSWDRLPAPLKAFDIIIASDVLYESGHATLLTQKIDDLSNDTTRVIVTDPGRAYLNEFQTLMGDANWLSSTSVINVVKDHKDHKITLMDFVRR